MIIPLNALSKLLGKKTANSTATTLERYLFDFLCVE
jgi:hypothetical protein